MIWEISESIAGDTGLMLLDSSGGSTLQGGTMSFAASRTT